MHFRSCEGCFKPAKLRLATNQDYECYAESYVKCFWNLCDRQHSTTSFLANVEDRVITAQPRRLLEHKNFSRQTSVL